MREIRLMSEGDLFEVAEIERLCFFEPWSQKSLELLLRDGNFGVVATQDGRVVGYAGVISAKPEGEITNVATHPDFRRMGIGEGILEYLKALALTKEIDSLYLEVRRSNESVRALYEKAGFVVVGERKGFYKNPKEDAILMGWTKG